MRVKRLVCALLAHRYTKAYHPDSDAGEFLLRCRRCGKERAAPTPGEMAVRYAAWDVGAG